jgi:hypothetical protein
MKSIGLKCGLLLGVATMACHAQTNIFDLALQGKRFSFASYELVNRIPPEKLVQLPKTLPVFRYASKPRAVSVIALQKLLNDSAFAGTNVIGLLKQKTNQAVVAENIKLTSQDRLDYFIVVPAEGRVISYNTERSASAIAADAVPSFDVVRDQAVRLAEMFGIQTNEMELNTNGNIYIRRVDGSNTSLGGIVKYKTYRSVKLLRSLAGFAFGSFTDEKIELELGVNGHLRKFDLRWPSIEAISTNKVVSVHQMMQRIKRGEGLADITNEYPEDGIAEVELKDFEIQYHVCNIEGFATDSAKMEIRPVISFYTAFKSKTGETEEGGIYVTDILLP